MNRLLYNQESLTIPLWKSTIPNAIQNEEYRELLIYEGNNLSSTSQVVTPTLTIFKPELEQENGTAVVICPGGGYKHLAMDKEGFKVAIWLRSLGITAFVLKYRLPSDDIMKEKSIGPLQDAQEAIRCVRELVEVYKLDTNKIGVLGFSAGGHLASTLSIRHNCIIYNSNGISAKPNFAILIYPLISMNENITHNGSRTNLLGLSSSNAEVQKFSNELNVNESNIITFMVHATDDLSVPVENSLRYYMSLKNHNVPVELHLFDKGGHGFGLNNNNTNLYWQENCKTWLQKHHLI
ncbi:esterase/lipase [Formosa agariphila KMM 3901]|uniref:Esterase/lipase n=1 Tax=Formosa agariphila (strain DSM 15362 / KCTC 12365 / LMG 23005 / KMM 3901 / M-2Alg 35-1) TaxID=1347342 RepID=T2KN86_FORAG|nr:alpha/beta hydrolase [Formosa agariphila]CDF80327.1 esterase/lipase [Formosa agariphila KMM 3901]